MPSAVVRFAVLPSGWLVNKNERAPSTPTVTPITMTHSYKEMQPEPKHVRVEAKRLLNWTQVLVIGADAEDPERLIWVVSTPEEARMLGIHINGCYCRVFNWGRVFARTA